MEQILPTQKYYYEKSDNVKIDNLRQDVNKYFDNSEKTHNFVNMLEKIIEDKDINIRLDENLTDTNGNIANGKYDNGTITINPNSDRAGEFIAIHELTHAIGTDSMRNIIENYRKSNVEFDNAVKSLLKNYNTTELTDEAMADVSAQLFGNQEYINNLAQTNPSLFRKIYNEIKYLWHQFTGYKNQNQFLEDLKYKWEQAYRRNNELNDTSNYYIQPLEEFNEMQYNNTKGLKLNNIEEYALREIVNSDSNIKPGINKVETTNATYTIYYKSTDDFKVITRKVDKSAGKLNKRNDYTRGKARYSLPYSESNGNQETARSNDEISNINKTRESERTGSTTSSSDNIRNSIENSEKSSFNLSENMQKRLNELKSIDTSKMGFLERAKIKYEIRSLEAGFNTVEEYEKVEREKREKALKEAEKEREERRKKIKQQEKEHEGYQMTHRPTESGAYASDISANGFIPKDVYEHPEWYFDMNRDFSKESFEVIKKIKGNPEAEITIYRATPSNTINKGDWVTLSRKYAEYHNESNLGGKGNIVELRVKAKDIQYAGDDINEFGYFPENEKYSLTTKDWQSYLDKNIESKGTKTNLQDIKLPIKKQLLPTNNLANNQENSNKSSFSYDKINSKIDSKSNINKLTNNGIIMTYVHMNNQNTQNYGATYGQNIEPAGQYMNVDTMQGKYKVPGAEYGTIQFNNPLVLDHINTGETGWKKTLSDMFDNKTGKELSDAIKRGGYDGIITIDEDGYYNEVVNLSGKKLDSIANNQELDESSSINLAKNETIQEEKFPTRHEIIQENRETARENIKNISTWKDKKSGIRYQLETMERNMYDIIPDKAEAKKINDTYFEPIHTSEAEKQKFINNYNDRIRQFDLNKYESEAVQFLGEKKYNPDFYKGSQEDISARNEIASKINKNIENGKIDQEKVNNAIEEFRKIYDELFELENNTLRENGYKEKPYRKGYFPHFVDYVPETKTEKVLNKLGFKIDKRPLPTDIAGITEQFVPGKTWNRSALERKGNKTDYNALKGFDTYIAQASDNIFHTENIQRLRGLENEIRYQYSDKGVQERIDNILNDETLFEEEKQAMIDGILEQVENPMPNLVTELRRYTNALANKKSEADRSIENMIGRPIYSTVNAIENRFGANAVGLNIGSAITNFIPITQAYSQVSTKNMGRAIIDTVKSYANNDGFVDKSVFLTSRLNQSEKLYKTSLEKISDKTSFLFNAIDEVTSNIVVRGKYLENIQNGMSEAEAIKNADQFARNVIADRSKGALPTKFEEKNPVTKMFTQFQLEVNNQYRYMFKDLPRDLAEKGLAGIALAFFKMFVGAWVYNEASEKITGRKPAFSPIDLVSSSYKTITDKDMKTYDKVASIGTDIAEQLPFVGGLVGGGRIPVNGAIPDVGNLTKAGIGLATGEMDSNRAMNTIGKELSKPLYYLLPPFGGGQIKKSVEGIQTVAQGGSYGVDNKGEKTLQFPVENPNAGDYIKAGLFGKYALPKAKEYVDGDFKSLSAKDTKLYKNSKIDYGILKKYIADRDEKVNNKAKSQETKIKIIKNLPVSTDQKWEIYKSDIFSTTERKDGTTEKEEYEKLLKQGFSKSTLIQWYDINKIESKKDEEGKAIEGSSQGQKALAIMKMNVSDDQKNKMLSLITTSKNPETVNTLSRLEKSEQAYTDYFALNKSDTFFQTKISRDDMQDIQDLGINQDEFMKFAENISNINSEKDANGKTISGSKKKAVANYINSLNLSSGEKAILFAKAGYPDNSYKQAIYNYINGLNLSATRKKEIWDSLGYK